MSHKIISSVLWISLIAIQCSSSSDVKHEKKGNPSHPSAKSLYVAFYNVENLFDTINDPSVDDEEFTPGGTEHWTSAKYKTKISNIARVIRAMNQGDGADIIGFSEVENKGVLQDLIADPQLKNLSYGIAHHDSPDKRGIDVAMIYKKSAFKVISQKFFTVDVSAYEDKPTRDIVLVQGIAGTNDTLNIFLNHWPSRREGKEVSEPKRIAAAAVLKKQVDELRVTNSQAKIVILGDLNDNPTDKSVHDILGAVSSPDLSSANSLYDCDFNFDWKKGEGSEFYRGEWSRFIQIIVSTSVIKNQITSSGAFNNIHIFKPDWLLITDPQSNQQIPHRTFEKDNQIGFSDHLPVYIEITE